MKSERNVEFTAFLLFFMITKKPAQNIVFVRAKALAYSVVIVSVVLLN